MKPRLPLHAAVLVVALGVSPHFSWPEASAASAEAPTVPAEALRALES